MSGKEQIFRWSGTKKGRKQKPGKILAYKKRENLWLFVDKDSLVPGLSEKMVGMKKSEERDIEATFPEKYPDRLAGNDSL